MSSTVCPSSSSGTVTTCDMTTALPSRHYGPQPEPPGTDEQAERSISAVRGGASLGDGSKRGPSQTARNMMASILPAQGVAVILAPPPLNCHPQATTPCLDVSGPV